MTLNRWPTTAAAFAAAMLLAAPPAAQANDQRLRCESPDYRYRSCPIRERGEVYLVRQISKTRCVQGRNWDYDRRAIWVDDGCAAEFVVEERRGGKHRRDRDDDSDRRR